MSLAVVLVPVLGRPQRAEPLVLSLRATSDAPLLFLCSPGDADEIVACKRVSRKERDVTVEVVEWPAAAGDFARKTNHGYRITSSDWIFCGADDLIFNRGWLEHAVKVGERQGAGVVGTDDLGNPHVKRGIHATHPLIRRSYIEAQGGTFDDSGDIYCELYDHQFVDTELVAVAKARRQWAFSKRSVVQHMHPHWGLAESDATYEKATRKTNDDRALFQQRMRLFQRSTARGRVRA